MAIAISTVNLHKRFDSVYRFLFCINMEGIALSMLILDWRFDLGFGLITVEFNWRLLTSKGKKKIIYIRPFVLFLTQIKLTFPL